MRFRSVVLVVTVLAVVFACGCGESKSKRAMNTKLTQLARTSQVEAEYIVAPPDELSIEVKGYPEYTRNVVVRPDGKITVPGMGDLCVQGKTIPAITSEVTEGISKELSQPVVTVTLVAARSKAIYVLGEVRRPVCSPTMET